MALAPEAILLLVALLVVVAMTWLHHARAVNGQIPPRRPLPALDPVHTALGRGAETGRAVHLSPGASVLGAADGSRARTAELLAGLLVVQRISSEAALKGAPILVTSGDVIAHSALRGSVRQAYQMAGQARAYDASSVQLLAHNDKFAYATGVATVYAREPLELSVLVGGFQQEFLLAGEEGAQRHLPQVIGTTGASALPLMLLTTPSTLIGEEIFAAEAYLDTEGPAQARLLTQDGLRTVTIVVLIGGLLYSLLQPVLNLPPLPSP
ncbi:hypothetical protein EYB53_006875 [Candidatus Chloroploca sp. M-50]|uniref:DUF6754 domain-containing protein n=1 Tax=Candidatus Chloroploca mongolica TaxID=2528176 RepID=A0ABS4D7N2_9CHLR|nr:DUF6754 domain-containing protein [Candidatus Chloroploca mongolica]MBP1465425.1 hypothetical protein [Candidatus Chloroploca mongolica]